MTPDGAGVWVIVAAAGESRRMDLPEGESKQFLLLAGEPIVCHSVRRLLALDEVAGVVVVLHPSHTVRFANLEVCAWSDKPLLVVEGGRRRTDSVRAGLEAIPADVPIIGVHDGARPLFSRRIFAGCAATLDTADGAIPAVPIVDTLKRAGSDQRVVRTIDRRELWAAQTPQLFRAAALRAAYERVGVAAVTDDASLLEQAGLNVVLVPSTPANVKITTPADLPLAAALLAWESASDV